MDSIPRAELDSFRSIVAARLGLQFDETKMDLLADVFRQRLEARGRISTGTYLSGLASGTKEREELRKLASLLTVGETYFFRGPEHFRALTESVLPERMRLGNAHRPLRILSAGCASGDEAYSLAIVLREHFPNISPSDVRIVGVDVNPVMLAKAKDAHYSPWSLRDTSAEISEKYFHRDGKNFILDKSISSMVTFEESNLAVGNDTRWELEQYDVIFCRNVIMYLVPEGAQLAVARLTRALAPAGFLFLSHAETLRGLSQGFHLRHTHETFYYQKREKEEWEPAPRWVSEPVPAMAEMDLSWVDAVRLASEHIESLSRDSANHLPRGQGAIQEGAIKAVVQTAPAQVGVALEFLRREKFQDALDVLRGLPPETTADLDAQLLRAVLLTNSGDVQAAERVCQEVLSADELNAGAHYLTALCRECARDTNGAMEHDRTAIYLDPGFAMPHLHLGLLAKRAGDLKTAHRELEQAGVLLPLEDASRILILGGGFSREALVEFSRAQLRACGGSS
jgi:chemotaxis protein methyltransferase CheR